MKILFSHCPLSPSALLGALPLLLLISGVLTLGSMVLRQAGFDSRTVDRVAETNLAGTLRIVTVLPRDAIAAIDDPSFVPAIEASRWMNSREQVIGWT